MALVDEETDEAPDERARPLPPKGRDGVAEREDFPKIKQTKEIEQKVTKLGGVYPMAVVGWVEE